MLQQHIHNIKFNIVAAFAVTMLFSCESNFKEVQKIGLAQSAPAGVAENFNLKRTDSGRVVANLISPKMLDYTNRVFGYNEFPEGLHLILFDDNNNRSDIFADYGIVYEQTDLIDLQGNVVVSTHSKDTLFAEQLYFDQKNEWVFTNKDFTLKSLEYLTTGKGFDSDSKLKNTEAIEINGVISVQE